MTKEVEFKSEHWKKFIPYRKKASRWMIKSKYLIGKTKREIKELFGKEDNLYDLDEWAYLTHKNLLGGKTFLLIQFQGEYVENQRLYTVYQLGDEAILTI